MAQILERRRALRPALLVPLAALAGACACDEDAGLLGRTPELRLTARPEAGEPYELLPGPRAVDFGPVRIGERVRIAVELRNAGAADLELEGAPALVRGDTGFALEQVLTLACPGAAEPTGGVAIAAGSCAGLVVVFFPERGGDASDELVVRSNDPGEGALRIPLRGRGTSPDAVACTGARCTSPGVSELTVDFGTVQIGERSSRPLSIENRGEVPLELAPYRLAGGVEFAASPAPAAATLQAAASLALDLVFSPAAGGVRTATLTVASDDPDQPALVVHLVGRGDAPAVCVEPFPALDFGDVEETTPRTLPLVVSSCGTLPLVVADLTLLSNGEYAAVLPATPATLVPGERLELPVTFTPPQASASPYPGRLKVTSDAFGDETVFVALTGRGAPPYVCDLQPQLPAIDFGQTFQGNRRQAEVVLQNLGAAPCALPVGSLQVAAGEGGVFRLASMPPLPVDVGPVGSPTALVRVTLEYVPADLAGPDAATLTATPANGAAAQVALAGTPLDPARFPCLLAAAPAALQFGVRALGHTARETVRLTNVGTATCNVSSASVSSGAPVFDASSQVMPFLGWPVDPGSTMDVQVTYRPAVEAAHRGNLRVSYAELGGFPGSGGPPLTLDVPLAGNGASPQLCVSPASVDLGQVPAGARAERPVQLLNCGGVDLDLRGLALGPGSHPGLSFAAMGPVPSVLAPGQTLDVTVAASPADAGAMRGTLEALSDDADSPATRVPLAANAAACDGGVVCRPDPLAFGAVDLGTSLVRSLVCLNPGTLDVSLAPQVPPPFSIVSAPPSIPAGGSGAVTVRFSPARAGAASATLDLGAPGCAGGAATASASGDGVSGELPICIPPSVFSPTEVWSWRGGGALPQSDQVWETPLVSRLEDTDGDGQVTRADMPRVVFVSFDERDWDTQDDPTGAVPGVLRAVTGDTGTEVFTVTDPAYRLNSGVTPAIVDLDADGTVEIVAALWVFIEGTAPVEGAPKLLGKFVRGRLIAFEHNGTFRWLSDEWTRREDELEDFGAVAAGDVDGDGFAELAIGDHLYDRSGSLRWRGGLGIGSAGRGPLSVLADVDGQPGLELVAGNTVYRADGSVLWSRADLLDGLPSVGDVNGDGRNEVVLRAGELHVLDGRTGATLAGPLGPPTETWMGRECEPDESEGSMVECDPIPSPAALVDLGGDAVPELVVANHHVILAYDGTLDELWRSTVSDDSGASGPAGFDFEGDGRVEAAYTDEESAFVYDFTGRAIYSAPHESVTTMEYAPIADADLDGHANLLVVSNDPVPGGTGGLAMFGNSARNWVHARPMWNQHAYVEGLVGELGAPLYSPAPEALAGFRTATPACR